MSELWQPRRKQRVLTALKPFSWDGHPSLLSPLSKMSYNSFAVPQWSWCPQLALLSSNGNAVLLWPRCPSTNPLSSKASLPPNCHTFPWEPVSRGLLKRHRVGLLPHGVYSKIFWQVSLVGRCTLGLFTNSNLTSSTILQSISYIVIGSQCLNSWLVFLKVEKY